MPSNRQPLLFGHNFYRLKSVKASAQNCINFYSEKEPEDSKTPLVIYGVPGLKQVYAVGTGPIRGGHVMNGILYVVSGNGIYSITSSGVVTALGSGISGSNIVNMADNGTQVGIVNGFAGYIYDLSTGFQQITDPNFYPANTITYFDGYFIFDKIGSNTFFYSNLNNGLVYGGLDYDSATVDSSFIVGIVNQQQNLLIFKQDMIETWYDTGANDNPFSRYNGATIERGCASALSIFKEDNSVFFLGNDRIAYRLDPPFPRRISTPAIEQEWQTYATVSDCQCFSITFDGHKFLIWNFATANKTWAFDIETNMWHERISYSATAQSQGRWRGNCSFSFGNQTLIGDGLTNQIGVFSSSVYDEYGNPIVGQITSPPLKSNRNAIIVNSIELDCQVGVGLIGGQGADPQMVLDWSKDGGYTWSAQQRWKSLGKIGEYLTRLRWTKFGQARQWVFRVTISDPVRRTIIGAFIEAEECDL